MKGGGVKTLAVEKLSIALSGGNYSFGDVVSLIIHDIEGASTVEATIEGNKITLVGDKDLVTDTVDPITGDHLHAMQTGYAQRTFDAAAAAVKASVEDLYLAHSEGWHGGKLAAAFQKAIGKDKLYTAERLVPKPVEDANLPANKQTTFWMHKSVDDFLSDKRTLQGLTIGGTASSEEFNKVLATMHDNPKEAKDAIQRSLIDPLGANDSKKIVNILKSILAHS